jgi:hypothetical protein
VRARFAAIVATCALLVGCHGDTVQDFSGNDSSTDSVVSTDSAAIDSTHDGSDSGTDSTFDETSTDSSIEGGTDTTPADVVVTDSGATCGAHPGPAMVEIIVADAGKSFCIDATEVTVKDYAAFVGSPTGFTPKCPGHDYAAKPKSAPGDGYPVVGVDWCDAYDYCQWAGKRLCGNINGGSIAPGEWMDATRSAWFYACTNGGTTSFPYGNTYQSTTCAGETYTATVAVGSLLGCHGTAAPFSAVFDMSGNVAEWEDGCDDPVDAADKTCPSRGGWISETEATMRCDDNSSQYAREYNDQTGFRCCSK